MRNPIQLFVIAAIMVAGLAASRPAAAQCDYACTEIRPGCERCLYQGPFSGSCRNVGACGCQDVQCFSPLAAEQGLQIDLGIVLKAPEAKQCTARTEPAAAVRLPFLPVRS